AGPHPNHDVAQVSKPAVSPISKSAARRSLGERRKVRLASGFGNPRHSRLGSLRYPRSAQLPLVAQVSKPAVSPISKSAARRSLGSAGRFVQPAGLETRDTADLEVCATPKHPPSTCSAGFQTCRIADFQIGSASKPRERRKVRPASGFGNPRYSRLGSLRYLQSAQLPLVA